MAEGEKDKIDLFELFVAILLGLGAVGGAWSAYQGDLLLPRKYPALLAFRLVYHAMRSSTAK